MGALPGSAEYRCWMCQSWEIREDDPLPMTNSIVRYCNWQGILIRGDRNICYEKGAAIDNDRLIADRKATSDDGNRDIQKIPNWAEILEPELMPAFLRVIATASVRGRVNLAEATLSPHEKSELLDHKAMAYRVSGGQKRLFVSQIGLLRQMYLND